MSSIKFLETNQTKNISSIKDDLLNLINSATKNIYFSSWLIDYKPLVSALLVKSVELKGHVYCLTAIDQNYFHYNVPDDFDDLSNLSQFKEKYNFQRLSELSGTNEFNGAVEIRGMEFCHAKFLVADEKRAIVTSANFTFSSLENPVNEHDKKYHKHEIGIYINDENEVGKLGRLFKDLFQFRYSTAYGFNQPIPMKKQQLIHPPQNYLTELKISSNKNALIWTYDFKEPP